MQTNMPIIFIGGQRKAGTSMFLNLFDGHPDLLVYPIDITIFYAYYPEYIKSSYSDKQRLARLKRVIFDELREYENVNSTLNIDKFSSIFFNKINGHDLKNIGIVLSILLNSYQECMEASNKKYFVIKETSIEIYANELFEYFPNSRFLHLIRDPRDNYAAIRAGVKRYSEFGDDEMSLLHSVLHRGLLGMNLAIENQTQFGKKKYRVLKFEDVVLNTKNILCDICNYLAIEFEESLLIPTESGRPTHGNNYDNIDMYHVSTKNIGRWKERIHIDEASVIEFYFKGLMEKMGYELEIPRAQTLRPVSDFYKWVNQRYFYFDRFTNSS